jgi:hypothetical protein
MRKLAMIVFALLCSSNVVAQSEAAADRDAEIVYRIVSLQNVAARRVIFRSVTPEVKAALWRAHLRHFLVTHPTLSEVQRNVLSQFISVIAPELYRPRPDDSEWRAQIELPFTRMQESASSVLEPEQYREALTVLGPLPDVVLPVTSTLITGSAPSKGRQDKLQPDYCVGCYAPDCECNMGDNWCGWGGSPASAMTASQIVGVAEQRGRKSVTECVAR